MPRDGVGAYTFPAGSLNPAVTLTPISSADWNAFRTDLIAAISASLAANGVTPATAPIPLAFGVKFAATQNASADANTLDDYEEGTYTPGVTFGGAAVGIAYTAQTGRYTKIGNVVLINQNVILSNNGTSTGSARTTALPFTSASGASFAIAALCEGFGSGISNVSAQVVSASTTIALYSFAAGNVTALNDTTVSDTANITLAGHYKV